MNINKEGNLTGCACVINGYRISAGNTVHVYKSDCASLILPWPELISNPVVLGVKSIYIQLLRVVMVCLGWKMCGCVWKAWGSNKVHNQAKLSSTSCWENQRDPTLTQQNLIEEASESRQSMFQEWKYCHSVLPVSPASELNTYKKSHFLILQPWWLGFLSASYCMSKNLKLKALSIMSFPVSSHTVVVATMESWQRYWCLHKQQQREERCLTDP